jgi:hypothetical protein
MIFEARIEPRTSNAAMYGFEVLVAIGSGSFIQAGYATIQTVIDPSETADGIAFMMLAQFMGIVFGLSVSGAIFVNEGLKALRALLPQIPEAQLKQTLSGKSRLEYHCLRGRLTQPGTSSRVLSSLSPDLAEQALVAIVKSLRKMLVVP